MRHHHLMELPVHRAPNRHRLKELAVAVRIAEAGSSVAMRHFLPLDSGSTAPDQESETVMRAELAAAFPCDAVLSAQVVDVPGRHEAKRVWILNPLDGAVEFLQGLEEFAVLVALAIDGEPALSVVCLPLFGEVYTAVRGAGAWLRRQDHIMPLVRPVVDSGRMRVVVPRSHEGPLVEEIRMAVGAPIVRRCGSTGFQSVLVARGEADIFVHAAAGLKEWETCAGDLLVREVDGSVTDCLGDPLRYNKVDSSQPHGVTASGPGFPSALRNRVVGICRRAAPAGEAFLQGGG